jgi:antitoxin FitA
MADVRVRNLEDWVVDAYRSRARRHHRSLEGELREFLRNEITGTRKQLVDRLENNLRQMEAQYGLLPDSAEGIRDGRDARG